MAGSQKDDEDPSEFARVVQENHRPWAGYWAWKDKPVMEISAARTVLTAAGIEFNDLRARPERQDPPDCEAMIDGVLCGIEVTELVDEKSLQVTQGKASPRSRSGSIDLRPRSVP